MDKEKEKARQKRYQKRLKQDPERWARRQEQLRQNSRNYYYRQKEKKVENDGN